MFKDDVCAATGKFHRSTRCSSSTCVEVMLLDDGAIVRDSKQTNGTVPQPTITVGSMRQWALVLAEALGEAAPGSNGAIAIDHLPNGDVCLRELIGEVALTFDRHEFAAWVEGIRLGEFGPLPATA